jgi:thiamine-phosphate pyrophosphorylase
LFRLPPVYPILDTASLERLDLDICAAAEALLEGGARILQFRHKSFWNRKAVEAAERIARLCAGAAAAFVVNDRADYAALIAAASSGPVGLHLGQEDLAPADARLVTDERVFIGFSTHNPAQAQAAQAEPADYVAFGPVFGTRSKFKPGPKVGLAGLEAARKLVSKPLVAIGGITRDNAQYCLNAGADSVAVIADLLPQPCTREALRDRMIEWRQRIRK